MKTKIILIAMFFSSITYSCFAQINQEQDNKHKWQVALQLGTVDPMPNDGFADPYANVTGQGIHRKDKSYNGGMNINYTIKGNFAARVSIKMTKYNIEATSDTREQLPFNSSQYSLSNYNWTSSAINISPGILWTFPYKIIYPYAGFEVDYKKYEKANLDELITFYDTLNNFLNSQETKLKQGGGYTIGVGPFVGFSMRIYKKIFIGTELSFALSRYKFGGLAAGTATYTTPTSATAGTFSMQQTSEGFGLLNIYFAIHLSIKF